MKRKRPRRRRAPKRHDPSKITVHLRLPGRVLRRHQQEAHARFFASIRDKRDQGRWFGQKLKELSAMFHRQAELQAELRRLTRSRAD